MSSPKNDGEEPSSCNDVDIGEAGGSGDAGQAATEPRPPAKRRMSSTAVIEISDTESDDSDVCAITSYQASADEVKRIRGADYSSSSSSSSGSYSSDSESSWEDDSILLADTWLHGKRVRAQLNPRANRMEDPKLNSALKSQDLIEKLKTHWNERKDMNNDEITLTCEPFRLCLLHDLLGNADIINNIVDDMNTLDWTRKKMDLYEFYQTVDLANLTWQRSIKGIYELLKSEVMNWVAEATGLQLTSVSASCALYGPGDHLLAHDDRLGARRVAFILYLAPWPPAPAPPPPPRLSNGDQHAPEEKSEPPPRGWSPHMGGSLELFSLDARGQPATVARRVCPRNNMLAFFQVGPETYHQVSEVLSLELPRLSINGWFHGPAPPGEPPAAEPEPEPEPELIKPHNEVVLLNQWVDEAYMSPANRLQLQKQMERDSEAQLRDFLQPAALAELLEALRGPDVEWEEVGPWQRRHYRRLVAGGLGAEHPARRLLALAGSAAFARLLADCTDLPLAGYQRLELQRWGPRDYTLLPPREHYSYARLEVSLCIGAPARALQGGGAVYLCPEEGGEGGAEGGEGGAGGALLAVPPRDNALALVYADAGAAAFTKYLSRMTMKDHECFYVLAATYRE